MEIAFTFFCCALTSLVTACLTVMLMLPALIRGRQAQLDIEELRKTNQADRLDLERALGRIEAALMRVVAIIEDAGRTVSARHAEPTDLVVAVPAAMAETSAEQARARHGSA